MPRLGTLGSGGALVASALLIAACGGSTTAPNSAPLQHGASPSAASTSAATTGAGAAAGDACSVVTKAEVSAVVGYDIATTSGAGGVCAFQAADPSKYFYVTTYSGVDSMASMLQIESGSTHLDGVGTDAFWVPSGVLFARNGDHAVAFSDPELGTLGATTAGATLAPAPDALVQLAKTALGRLG